MKKKVAISLVVAFVLGFLWGYQVNLDSSKNTIQPILKKTSSMEKKKGDSLQVQKTDVQCFVEAMIISIWKIILAQMWNWEILIFLLAC